MVALRLYIASKELHTSEEEGLACVGVYVLATSKVISVPLTTCESVHSCCQYYDLITITFIH